MKNPMMLGAMLALALCTAGFSACSTGGNLTAQQQDNVAAACTTANAGLDGATSAFLADRIPRASLVKALAVHKATKPWCQPVATSISTDDYAKLIRAAAELSTIASGESK